MTWGSKYEGVHEGAEAAVRANTAKMMEMIIVIFKYEGRDYYSLEEYKK